METKKGLLVVAFLSIILVCLSFVSATKYDSSGNIVGVCTGTCYCSGRAFDCPCDSDPCVICGPTSPECREKNGVTADSGNNIQDYGNEINTQDPQTPQDYVATIGKGLGIVFSDLWKLISSPFSKKSDIEQWQDKIIKQTGPDSIESKTLAECAQGMSSKIEECSKNEGWRVDNQLSITDFKTNKNYELQGIRQGGCEGMGENDSRPFTSDSKLLDAQSEGKETSFQVVCSIACYSWPCKN
jgi:hypothetical protein